MTHEKSRISSLINGQISHLVTKKLKTDLLLLVTDFEEPL